jgi:hypothetical protein
MGYHVIFGENMTDSNVDLESLVTQYEQGVANRESSDAQSWLEARTSIESQWDQLSTEQIDRVQDTDRTLAQNAGLVASRLAASGGGSLRDLRATTPRPPEQWWWYLDTLAHVSDVYGTSAPAEKAPASMFSRLLTAVEVVVLLVAIFFLGQRVLEQVRPASSGGASVQSTPLPSWTPAPTETINAVAFDMSQSKVFKSPDNVIEMQLPPGWEAGPSTNPGFYIFTVGPQGTPSATVQVAVGEAKDIYDGVLRLAAPAASPQEALDQLRKSSSPDSPVKFSDVRTAKIGKYDGYALTISVPADPQRGDASELELRLATLPDGKLTLVIMQSAQPLWATAQPTQYKMIDSLVVNPQAIPTQTPTATLHPLLLTASAIQQQILNLTPSPTPTPAATGAATGDATGAATGAVAPTTGAATPAAPSAATAAATAATF